MGSSIRDVKGLVALITGGASGLGEATARRLLQKGASVVICDLPSSKGEEVAKELGEKCIFVPVDVTKEADVQQALNITKTKFQKLDVVVNCAGICIGRRTYDYENDAPHPLQDYEKVLSVNTTGTLNVIRLAVGLMGKNQPDEDGQRGVVINTASIAAYEGQQNIVAYAASKGAVVGMTLPLARDLGSQGIRCCSIAPGFFDTPMLRTVGDELMRIWSEDVPFPKRMGKPDEFAHLVQTIIENPMLNGCVIRIDGGVRMRPTSL